VKISPAIYGGAIIDYAQGVFMTELIWDGKYDQDGKRVAPLRIALPFQTVETVNESAQARQRALDLFNAGRDPEWRNRLIWGDKKYVLPSLLEEFAGKMNLIYIDPPFNVGADFSFTATIPDHPDTDEDETTTFTKEPSVIEMKAYRDTWGRGLDSYLQWFYETVVLLRELLAENGSIYVHLDWHMAHYAKVVLDEVFSLDRYVSEIVWKKLSTPKAQTIGFGSVHDVILFYSKSRELTFNQLRVEHDPDYLETMYRYTDKDGRRYRLHDFTQKGQGVPRKFGDKVLVPPPGKHWIWSQDNIDEGMKKGLIVFSKSGMPQVKRYLDEVEGHTVDDIWSDVNPIGSVASERLDYPTQKPEALLERILKASSNENDLVLDCFVGSGTTAAVAEKLNRRWIACDLGRFAIHTTRKRLLSIENVRPFVVQNLGKYERQVWQKEEFGGQPSAVSGQQRYREFILHLYNARAITGYTWLHGIKGGRMVHVGAVDAPVSVGDVQNIVTEFKRAIGTGKDAPAKNGVDVLGWDFAFELNEVAKQQAAQANINLRFMRIPRDVMDKKAVEQGDIRFFELAALEVEVRVGATLRGRPEPRGRPKSGQPHRVAPTDVTLTLTDFVIPPDDVPQDVQRAIKHWSQWIDYWAVDWDNKGDTFHNEWQTYRTRKSRDLQLTATHTYDAPGEYTIVVKVIDILGNDTTKAMRVKVG
jgi:adenine specific DNA methylase Mod